MSFSILMIVQRVRLWGFWAVLLAEIFMKSLVRLQFFWLRLLGRQEQIKAIKTRMVSGWTHSIVARLGCKVEVEGAEHIPMKGPLVVMANHQSMYDIPLLMSVLGRMVGFVAKKELFRIPGFSYWMREIGSVNLDRSDPRSAAKMFREVAAQMKESESALVLFPEGTRTRDPGGAMGPFKDGSLRLPAQGEIPILPVSLDGSRLLSRPEAMVATRHGGRVIRVKIAPPVVPSANASAPQRREFMARLRETIAGNYDAIRVQWPTPDSPASPPPSQEGQ